FILIACTLLSLLLANSALGESYVHFWHAPVGGGHTVEHLINDGLMTLFFLLVGLEIEREIYQGELSDPRAALLPVFAALGGMACPALIHWLFNAGEATARGAGIPTATDIAFALGVLMLLGKRVPVSLKIFLTALAIIDDLGAIIVIAVFYSAGLDWGWLGAAGGIFAMLAVLNRLGVNRLSLYLLPGLAAWYCMLHSGVHATLTGVILAFLVPFRDGGERSPSHLLEHRLTGIVAFGVLPLFALANTGIVIPSGWYEGLFSHNSLGIMMGLMAGKPLGIFLFSLLAVTLGLCRLPDGMNWKHVLGAGLFGGIGFTMSMFVTLLAFNDPAVVVASKIAIMAASVLSAVAGLVWLRLVTGGDTPALQRAA
ncbi:MAG TPA: Na+/H+ antiporter NhaA, partial [Fluviicoccus sp.]|nr:Na+/H+ antiporter NhaA [Fluviicoccus sp.]